MPRKMVVKSRTGDALLEETPVLHEVRLQELVRSQPDLLPIADLGFEGPLLTIGRETPLPSGAIDLVALARSGEILLVEFKTGPENSDFRAVLAQLLDYGSDLWRMAYADFEEVVARRYFTSRHCTDKKLKTSASLAEALSYAWPDLRSEESAALQDSVRAQLDTGGFTYVVASQRFPETVLRTVDYLNAMMRSGSFVAVEIIGFEGAGLAAFESRTVLKPSKGARNSTPIDFERLLAGFGDREYQDALRSILEACRGFGFMIALGSVGLSIRMVVAGRTTPVSVAWLFPGDVGWYGLRGFTLGYEKTPSIPLPDAAIPILDEYLGNLGKLPSTKKVAKKGLTGFQISRETLVHEKNAVIDALLKVGGRLASLG